MANKEEDFGRQYAEWLLETGQVELGDIIDVDSMVSRTSSIPDDDYRQMVNSGIRNPNARIYWQGYNKALEQK
ncbi:MAG: hypothetical protein ACLP29_02045 [Dissulfurispiraceae bacterium]